MTYNALDGLSRKIRAVVPAAEYFIAVAIGCRVARGIVLQILQQFDKSAVVSRIILLVRIYAVPGAGTTEDFQIRNIAPRVRPKSIEPVQIIVALLFIRRRLKCPRQPALRILVGIHLAAQGHLFGVVKARDPVGLFLGPGQGRQKQCRQNGDDGDHHQQFDERKGAGFRHASPDTCLNTICDHRDHAWSKVAFAT